MKKILKQKTDSLNAPDENREVPGFQSPVTSSGAFSASEKALILAKDIFTSQELDELWPKEIKVPQGNGNISPSIQSPLEFIPALPFSSLITQEFPKARFTLDPFFEASTVNMVSAPPNTWKSWLLFYFSVHIASGTKAFGKFETEKAKVMIVNEEDSHRSIQDRFKLLGITDPTLELYFRIAQGAKIEEKFIDEIIKECQDNTIGVVIFDSLRAMHLADENDSTAMQGVLDLLKKMARAGITVIFTHHNRKKSPFEKGTNPESSRGSSAINAAISGHISLEEKVRDDRLFLMVSHLKSKAGEKLAPFEIEIKKLEDGTMDFKYSGEYKSEDNKVQQAKNMIIGALEDGSWKTVKDMTILNVGKTILRQALTVLKNEGVITFMSRGDAMRKGIGLDTKGKANELIYGMDDGTHEVEEKPEQLSTDQEFHDF